MNWLGIKRMEHSLVKADHHANLRPTLVCSEGALVGTRAITGDIVENEAATGLGQARYVRGALTIAPQAVDAADGADKVAVTHVGEGAEVCLVTTTLADAASGAHPHANTLRVGRGVGPILGVGDAQTDKGGVAGGWPGRGRHLEAGGHGGGMTDGTLAAAAFAHEGAGDGEDGATALASLDSAGAERATLADALDMVEDGGGAIAGEDEEAVVRVNGEVGRDCPLRRLGSGLAGVRGVWVARAARREEGLLWPKAGVGWDV